MIVKNRRGTGNNRCYCGSWLRHWVRFSKKRAGNCKALGCYNTATEGAHVNKVNSVDSKWYIVPFCVGHNQTSGNINLKPYTKLVSANVRQTCG